MRKVFCIALTQLAATLLVAANVAIAESIPVVHGSFEVPHVTSPDAIAYYAPGWNVGGDGGVLDPLVGRSDGFGLGGPAPDGTQVGWTYGNSNLIQDIGAVKAGWTYTLSAEVGALLPNTFAGFGDYRLILGYGGHDLATTNVFAIYDGSGGIAPGTYKFESVTGIAPGNATGDVLVILIGGKQPGGQQGAVLFDDVKVAAVPEPSSFALLRLGAIGLMIARRRRTATV